MTSSNIFGSIKRIAASALLIVSVAFVENAVAQSVRSSDQPELRSETLHSKVFGNDRTLRILLPKGYDDRANRFRRYPVLYLNDGQDLFDASTSIFNRMEWRVDETVAALTEKKEIRDLIVVGIDNAGKRGRSNEYLPYPDEFLSPPVPDPHGGLYPKFLTTEVLPFIDSRYRTLHGPENTGIGGSSYGALVALYSVIHSDGKFGLLLLESPSLYVDNAKILDETRNAGRLPKRIYVGVGTNESGSPDCKPGEVNNEAVDDVLRLKKIIEARKRGHAKLKVVVEACAVHNEDAWAKRLPEALRFLFGTK